MSVAAPAAVPAHKFSEAPRPIGARASVSARARPAEGEPCIRLLAAVERGCHPLILWGRFRGVELMSVRSIDGRAWHREGWEACETFEDRVVRDLEEAAL